MGFDGVIALGREWIEVASICGAATGPALDGGLLLLSEDVRVLHVVGYGVRDGVVADGGVIAGFVTAFARG